MYTVKQLAKIAGVTVRTLHYYDEIGLLKPSSVGENGYRYYADPDLFRLQQILFFRELDLGLEQIKQIVSAPDFDLIAALQTHRQALEEKIGRMQQLVTTVDRTIMHLVGEMKVRSMSKVFEGFSAEKQREYEEEAARRYGTDTVAQTTARWNSYSPEQQAQIMEEGKQIYQALGDAIPTGVQSAQTQALLARWHQHLRAFYEPSFEGLAGLGYTYEHDSEFNAFFAAIHPDLPTFMAQAVAVYVDALETAWLERELNILEE
jgi:MerR family transcriptional regulator, thiopeptide resistance regulator